VAEKSFLSPFGVLISPDRTVEDPSVQLHSRASFKWLPKDWQTLLDRQQRRENQMWFFEDNRILDVKTIDGHWVGPILAATGDDAMIGTVIASLAPGTDSGRETMSAPVGSPGTSDSRLESGAEKPGSPSTKIMSSPLAVPIPERRPSKIVHRKQAAHVVTVAFCFQNGVVLFPVHIQTAKFVDSVQ
jgi:hypothetical protein